MRHDAEANLRAWVQSPFFVQLENSEVDQLLAELVDRQYSSPPNTVDRIVRRMFPQYFTESGEKNMSRVVPKLESRAAAPTPPPQSAQDLEAVMQQYINTNHWTSVARGFAEPWAFRDGQMFVGSRTNMQLLKNKLKEMGVRHLRVADVAEAVFALAQAGVFERTPVQAPPPPPPAKPTERELHNRQVKIERKLNDRDTSPIRGAKEAAKPLVKPIDNSNLIEAAASEKAAKENAIVNTAIERINAFQGSSHSRTASGRAAMREAFQAAMDAGKPAEEVLAAVEAEASRLVGNDSIH